MKFRIATYASVLVLTFVFIGSNLFGNEIDDLKRKSEQGDSDAQTKLGVMYYKGEGVIQDYVQAHAWFNVSLANGGNKNVQKKQRNGRQEDDLRANRKSTGTGEGVV